MENISNNVTYAEGCRSSEAKRLGIANIPNEFQLANMKLVAVNCFQPAREHFGKEIFISSFLRGKLLNEKKGGSKTSQHLQGLISGLEEGAMDLDCDVFNNGLTNSELFNFISKNVEFDQLIWEFGTDEEPSWVHVSYRKNRNRKMKLKAILENDEKKYLPI